MKYTIEELLKLDKIAVRIKTQAEFDKLKEDDRLYLTIRFHGDYFYDVKNNLYSSETNSNSGTYYEKGYKLLEFEDIIFLSESDEKLLAEARKRYPVGTKFHTAHADTDRYCIVTNENIGFDEGSIYSFTDDGGRWSTSSKYGNTHYNRILYFEGKWAKIVEEKSFTLPEKWCIKTDIQEVVDYCNKYGKIPPYSKSVKIYAHFPSPDGYCTTFYEIKNGYTEITLEQFKKHVLKQENMKIIGYKLKENLWVNEYRKEDFLKGVCAIGILKNTPTVEEINKSVSLLIPDVIDNYRKAGVLDLWFEPVYEDEYKVGDYFVCIKERQYFKGELNKVYKIINLDYDVLYYDNYSSIHIDRCRKATPEEIKASQKEIVKLTSSSGDFELEVSKEGIYYAPDKKWLNIDDIRHFANLELLLHKHDKPGKPFTGVYTIKIKTLKVGCKDDTKIEDWKKVIEIYDKFNK